MRVDFVVPNEGRDALAMVHLAPRFEEMGYTGLWFTDHVIGYSSFPAIYGADRGAYWLECLSTLSYVAATTSKIRLGLGVLVLPYRDAVLAAKMLATIDQLSGGRLDLGIGTGVLADEFAGLGRDHLFEKRGAYTTEALEVFQYCWRQKGELSFNGSFINFSGMLFEPKPVQVPRIPIWIGSKLQLNRESPMLHRVVRYADIWHPTFEPGTIPPTAQEISDAREFVEEIAGRPIPVSLRLHSAGPLSVGNIIDLLASYRDKKVVQVAIELGHDDPVKLLEKAEQIITAVRGAGILIDN